MITERDVIQGLHATPSPLQPVKVERSDYLDMAIGLATAGWSTAKAADMVNSLDDNDGGLQMLARRRRDLEAGRAYDLPEADRARARHLLAIEYDRIGALGDGVRLRDPAGDHELYAPAIEAVAAAQRQDANGRAVFTIGSNTARLVFKPDGITDLSDTQAVLDATERALVALRVGHVFRALPNAIDADATDMLDTIDNAADDWKTRGYTSALAEVRDMANVGRDMMERLPDTKAEGVMQGWSPMDCPSEIVTDMLILLEEAKLEIARLRGLLIDPGSPPWEDGRAILVAELRKHGMTKQADRVATGGPELIPTFMVLNLIGHSRIARAHMRDALTWYREKVEGCRKLGSIGDPHRAALDEDGGKRAEAALNGEKA